MKKLSKTQEAVLDRIEIISYLKFKNTSEYKKYTTSVVINIAKLGYSLIQETEVNPREISINSVKKLLKIIKINAKKIVFYRTKDKWGLPYIFIFAK